MDKTHTHTSKGEEVVISGLSGVFPDSGSVLELADNLFNKVYLTRDNPKWTSNKSKEQNRVGKISNIDELDAKFFKIDLNHGAVLTLMTEKILQHAYGAIFDSGNSHVTLKGKKLGVYIGVSFDDFNTLKLSELKQKAGVIVPGNMTANLISYWLDGRGPSCCLDAGCASSTAALEKAYQDIKSGVCDAAIVGTGNMYSDANPCLNSKKSGAICLDGECLDRNVDNGDGFIKAETISVLFLQKAKDAKRIYAEVYHVKGMYGIADAMLLPVEKTVIHRLLAGFYSEIDIRPTDIEYIEVNGTGIFEVDTSELDVIEKVFASDKIVKIGCVKSNMGDTEAAAGLTAVIQICIAYHKGKLPANINFLEKTPDSVINYRKLQLLNAVTEWSGGYTAINNFSLSGANYHVVLKDHNKKKNLEKYKSSIPHIVLASGRQKSSVSKIFDWLKSKPIDEEEIALLHGMFEKDIPDNTVRGYIIFDKSADKTTLKVTESATHHTGTRRPLWFVFSGMGSHWVGMGADMMRIPTFRKLIERCHKVLEAKGVDIIKIISGPDKTIFDNILNAFLGIGAVQIGLTDILKEMGVEPDYIIGCSLGETCCAYQKGTLSVEETILAAYVRGKTILEDPVAAFSPVYNKKSNLFEEITDNAVIVEIAPHSVFQSILERSHPKCTYISLMRRDCKDGIIYFLESIGKLYEVGYNPKVDVLYTKVEFPVSTETPFLSHLVEWKHNETCHTAADVDANKVPILYSRDLTISLHDDDYSYIADVVIDGVTCIPEAALLVYVWETVATYKNVDFPNPSIEFVEVQFHSDVIVEPETNVKITVTINKTSNKFEITHNQTLVASGFASGVNSLNLRQHDYFPSDDFDDIRLNSKDVYQILNMRGYSYKNQLQCINSVNINKNIAYVQWTKNWVLYLESLFQLNIFLRNHNGISKINFVRYIKVDISEHIIPKYNSIDGIDCFNAQFDKNLENTRSAGVEISGVVFEDQQSICKKPSHIRDKRFYPYFSTEIMKTQTALEIMIQIIAENAKNNKINLIKYFSEISEINQMFQKAVDNMPDYFIEIKPAFSEKNNAANKYKLDKNVTNVLVCENMFADSKILFTIQSSITIDDYVITLEDRLPYDINKFESSSVLACMSGGKQILILLKKTNQIENVSYVPITSFENNFSWISKVKNELARKDKVVLVSENQSYTGALGFVHKLRNDGFRNLSLVAILDDGQNFDSSNVFYVNQLNKNLAMNILKKGQWGGYYHTYCNRTANVKNFVLSKSIPRNFETLTWIENSPCFDKTNLVQVSFAGLSTYDCLKSIDDFSTDAGNIGFGMDFSGIDAYGDRIMGLISGGAMASSIQADADLIWPVPEHWRLEDAATVPLPYVLAYYCLTIRYKLKYGERVFITNGAEAFGQALISLCLAIDCIVFTTITETKQKMCLSRLFPKLDENNICLAKGDSFYSKILAQTKGYGCHLVVNTFSGSLFMAAMKCVGARGTFLDHSHHEMLVDQNLTSNFMESSRTYKIINLLNVFKPEYVTEKKRLQYLVSEGIASGVVVPLPRVVFPPAAVSTAFRLVSMGTNVGRVLMKLRDPILMSQGLTVTPSPQDVVIVVSDNSSIGIALTDKLIQRGVRKLILHMDTTQFSGYAQYMFISWSKRKLTLELSSENLRIRRGCDALVKKAMKFGKVKAVFIVLDGNGDINVRDEFTNAYNKMCSVALNLDLATRKCTSLSYFTIVTREPESAGEEYAVAVLERASELRRQMGLAALVIRHSLAEFNKFTDKSNELTSQTFSTFFIAMEISLKNNYQNVFTYNRKADKSIDFCKTVAKIIGVQDIEVLENETTLQDLNLNGISLKELRATIKDYLRIDFYIKDISTMSILSLKNLKQRMFQNKTTDFKIKIPIYYKKIDFEEPVIQEAIVSLPTRNMSSSSTENKLLLMLPGFEGRCNIFYTEAEKLKIKAIGVNYDPDFEGNTIREIALNIRQLIHAEVKIKSKFYILGYSFGANIALELAAIFEEEGITGVVYCLDSSPHLIRSHLDASIGKISENEMEDVVLSHFYHLIATDGSKDIGLGKSSKSFEDKIEFILSKLRKGKVSYSQQYMRQLIKSAYKRITLAKKYEPKIKLKSELVLLKGITHPEAEDLAQDYNLSQYSEKPIKVFQIKSDHGLAFADVRVSNIINGHILGKN